MKGKRLLFNFMLFFSFSYGFGLVYDFIKNLVMSGKLAVDGEKYLFYAVLLSIGLTWIREIRDKGKG